MISYRNRAVEDPEGFINSLGSKAIIDEAHNTPEILSVIQAKVDEDKSLRYILTRSSNFALMQNVSQSLAGRVAVFTLLPFPISEFRAHIIKFQGRRGFGQLPTPQEIGTLFVAFIKDTKGSGPFQGPFQ